MGSSPLCDDCNNRKAIVCCKTDLATLCLQCDWKLHSHVTEDNHNHSRYLLCSICVSQAADYQCLDGLSLCQKCVTDANPISGFFFPPNSKNNSSGYNYCPLNLDLDSPPSSCSSSVIDPCGFPYGSLPLNNGDSSSSFTDFFPFIDNYTNNYSDIEQVPMLDIFKEGSCSGIDDYKTKEDIENVLLNNPDGDEAVLEYFTGEDSIIIDELAAEISPLCSSLGIHKDYNREVLATPHASSQDYNKNQMIGLSKAKEETNNNNLGMFPNSLVQIDCGQSQLILTDKMFPWDEQTLVSNVYNPRAREEAKKRYFAKKMKRKFGKQIRYESRKSTADTKRRMKGRFTKAGAEYDYDPRANNTNKEMNKIMT